MGDPQFNGQALGSVLIHEDGVDYDARVDARRFSPAVVLQGQPPAHPEKPYFYSAERLAEEAYGCHIRLNDTPVAAKLHAIAEFETAIVFSDFDGQGTDRVLAAYRWGYTCAALGQDPTYSPKPGGALINFPEEASTTSPNFKSIVHHDYPNHLMDEFSPRAPDLHERHVEMTMSRPTTSFADESGWPGTLYEFRTIWPAVLRQEVSRSLAG